MYTSLPMILAEELECDWQKVRIEMAPVGEAYQNPAFHMQGTGGSTSVRAFMQPLRQAGAAAREMLKLAAAKRWGVPVAVPRRGRPGGAWPEGPDRALRRARRGGRGAQAAGRAAAQGRRPVPPDRPAGARLDLPDKVRGAATFGIDVRLPGMVYATIRQSPVFGGKVRDLANRAEVEPARRARRGAARGRGRGRGRALLAGEHGGRCLEVAWAEVPAPASTMRRSWRCSAPRSTARGGRDGARRRRPGARRRGQGGRGRVRAAVPRARHHGADERDRARHGDGWRSGRRPRARDRSPARWRRSSAPARGDRHHTTFLGGGFGRRFELDFALQAARCPRRSAGRCS